MSSLKISIIVVVLIVGICPETGAGPMYHQWSQRFGDAGHQLGYSAAVDGAGNVFVTGYFQGSADFGGGTLNSAGGWDIFVAKFDPAGNHIWSQRFGDASNDYARGAAVDGSGNVIVTGGFYGSVDFGGGLHTSAGFDDIFVAKFDAAGNHIWSRRFGDASRQGGWSTAVDGSGRVFVTGEFDGSVDFGGGLLTSAGLYDIFVAKFDAAGVHIWSQRFGSGFHEVGRSAAVDGFGNVVVTGDIEGSVDFGGGLLTSAGGDDVFVAKFDPAGNHIWSRRYGDASDDFARGAAVDVSGNVIVTGYFYGSVDFGGALLTSAGAQDIFVAKFNPDGHHLWSQRFGAAASDRGQVAAVDGSRNVIVTGEFSGSVDFGGGPITSAGGVDIFVAKFDTDGNHI